MIERDARGNQVEPDRCPLCGMMSKRMPRAGKLRRKHNCPHGLPCPAANPLVGVHANSYPIAGHASICVVCRSLGTFRERTWQTFMQPTVDVVTALEVIATWWADAYLWRTAESEAGRGNPYDWDPGGRVPRSAVRTKFQIPWTQEIEGQLARLILVEAKRRGYKDFMKQARRWETDRKLTSLGF